MTPLRRATFLLYATIQFVVLTFACMQVYPGGTLFDPTTRGYGFFDNFFSDLGTTVAYSGKSNLFSCVMFVIALTTIGIALVLFSGIWRSYAFAQSKGELLGRLSHVCGIISGLCFVGIACTPWNLILDLHNLLVLGAFSLLLAFVVSIVALLVTNRVGGAVLRGNLVYLAVLAGYVLLIFFGPNLRTAHGHAVQVAGQKLIVYASMGNVLVQALVIRRLLMKSQKR